MKIGSVQLINSNKFQFLNNFETLKQDNISAENKTITVSLWNTENKFKYSYIPNFSKVSNPSELPPDHEKPGNFKVRNINGLICPGCGRPMLSAELYEELKQNLNCASEEEYVAILSGYIPYMREVEANVMEEVLDLSSEEPDLTLQELVTELKFKKLPELEGSQLKILNDMAEYSNRMPRNERPDLRDAITAAKVKIELREIKHPFTKQSFVEAIKNLKIHQDKMNHKQILIKMAESLPSSNESECAWIVKYSGLNKEGKQRSSKEIADRILQSISTNTDHMQAQDPHIGGKDRISNYLAMHNGCNGEKGNKKFMEWFNEKPSDREIYIQQYLEGAQNAIDAGEIDDPRYQNYAQDAAETIERLSDGNLIFEFERANSFAS